MGASGDLAKRKLIPALYKLCARRLLTSFTIVGTAISQVEAADILQEALTHIQTPCEETWNYFCSRFFYVPLDFYQDADYVTLKKAIDEAEKKHNVSSKRLCYFATMPHHFLTITEKLAEHGIISRSAENGEVWPRVMYEKPFGTDLSSARLINKSIHKLFSEKQVYRVDHYLGKELVSNIALVRFTNLFFQPLWNKKYIDSVQITMTESLDIGDHRGEFYDAYGALKDVVQNHMLQLLALITMEAPTHLSGEHVRDAKTAVLRATRIEDMIRGQYEGYTKVKGVFPKSSTETFAALKLRIDNDRWRGVPFFLKTGKALEKKCTRIDIQFKKAPCLLFEQNCPVNPNFLTISIEPQEGFFLELNAKKPGSSNEVLPVQMNFCHSCLFGPNSQQAYEVVLQDALKGDLAAFVRFDEIEYSWHIIDEAYSKKGPVFLYEKGSRGPVELENWSAQKNVRWRV